METLPDEVLNNIYRFLGEHPVAKIYDQATWDIVAYHGDLKMCDAGSILLKMKRNQLMLYRTQKYLFLKDLQWIIRKYEWVLMDDEEDGGKREHLQSFSKFFFFKSNRMTRLITKKHLN